MATEIERKYLVSHDGWRDAAGPGRRFRQSYITRAGGVTVRIRRVGDEAFLTVKGPRQGITRAEFEYAIPVEDAERMMRDLCRHPPLVKVRHDVPHMGVIWEVDVFEGVHQGLVVAEVELDRADQVAPMPSWIGQEITHDLRYRGAALARAAGRRRPLSGRSPFPSTSPAASSAAALPLG